MVGCTDDNAIKVAERIKQRLAEIEFPGIGRLDRLGRPRARAGARDEPARTRRMRRGGDDDREGAGQEPDRPLLRHRDRAARHAGGDARRSLDRAPQDAPEPQRQTQPPQRRPRDRRGDRRRAPLAHRLPQLPRFSSRTESDLVPIAFLGELSTSTRSLSLDVLRIKVGVGITGRCAELGESIVVGDAANCEFGHQIEGTPAIEESLLAVPLRYGSQVVGVIVVSKLGLDQFDEDEVRLLEVLAGHAAVAIENARLYESARREAESATALLEFGRELATLVELDEIVERVTSSPPRSSAAGTRPSGSRSTASCACARSTGTRRSAAEMLAHYDVPARCHLGRSRAVHDRAGGVRAARRRGAGVPAAATRSLPSTSTGVRAASSRSSSARTSAERELRLLGGLAHQAKLAIANASSYEGLERTFVSTVEALANALEANDEYTSRHARWISDLSLRVGGALGLDERALKRLELGALLHDIGKIGIPSDDPLQARPPHGAGAEDRPDASGARRADHRADRPAPGRAADRSPLPRALGRRRLSGPDRRRGHPARVADHLRLRRVPRDDHRSPVPPPPQPSRGAAPAGRRGGHAVRPGVVEVALGVLEHVHELAAPADPS